MTLQRQIEKLWQWYHQYVCLRLRWKDYGRSMGISRRSPKSWLYRIGEWQIPFCNWLECEWRYNIPEDL